MTRYKIYINKLSGKERDSLYTELEGWAFMVSINIKEDYLDVFWDSAEPLESVVKIPACCTVSKSS